MSAATRLGTLATLTLIALGGYLVLGPYQQAIVRRVRKQLPTALLASPATIYALPGDPIKRRATRGTIELYQRRLVAREWRGFGKPEVVREYDLSGAEGEIVPVGRLPQAMAIRLKLPSGDVLIAVQASPARAAAALERAGVTESAD
jgi:hypothetical protein